MPLLKRFFETKSTLIDYEKITDEKNRRMIYFGNFAGYAGMIDSFWALGKKFESQGLETPFLKVNQAYLYPNLENAMENLKQIGKEIDIIGLNFHDGPLIIGILGYGNVSKGVQEIINCFPNQELKPEELEEFFESGYYSESKIYYVVFHEKHLVKPKELEDDFELKDYYENPEKYESQFEKYITYLTVIINAIYWEPKYPRFVTKEQMKKLFNEGLSLLRVIGDISCDIDGAIELTVKTTTVSDPVYLFNVSNGKIASGFSGRGPVVLAIDNLPCELPKESSKFFSSILRDFVPKIAKANNKGDFKNYDIPEELKKGVIVYKGQLTPDFQYLKKFLV
jgi:alpha-aminoadipic semialdehyde synthase